MEGIIYLDHAATTPVDARVLEEMLPYFGEAFGNPATLYSVGMMAKAGLDAARERVAFLIGAAPDEIVFTGGGTEADNAALKGAAYALRDKGNHIVTTQIEHHAVLEPCAFLESQGFEVTYLSPDAGGFIHPEQVAEALTPRTILVSVMHANNEIGTIQPIRDIARVTRERGVLLHTDAVQTVGSLPVSVRELSVDLLSLSAHKFYGPKGVGALYVRRGTPLVPFLQGGGQEQGLRASTHNVPGIAGLGKAAEIAAGEMARNASRIQSLRDRAIDAILSRIPDARLNGSRAPRLPGNVNVCLASLEGEAILLSLDMDGICVASGSACATGSVEPSHVLLALGVPRDLARSGIRITFGRENTEEEADFAVACLEKAAARLRVMSPDYPRSGR
ncbi:MAG: cysteine desulfurase NifS [Armatimonadetes bacterium]|nr:cysteine desulfurase NifS [Armatimonadota bacterium]